MNKALAAPVLVALVLFSAAFPAQAQQHPALEIRALSSEGRIRYSLETQMAVATNGVLVQYGDAVLTAERAQVNEATGDVIAEGRVRVQRDELVWVGESIRYNFFTRKMESEQFRTGRAPFFAGAEHLGGDWTNNVYSARNAMITTDDVAEPASKIVARSITIIPGQSVEARHAVLYLGKVPVFYFPYYTQRLDGRGNRFDFVPGYRTRYGPFLLTTYNWVWDEHLDGALHADYRQKRGGAGGADFNLHLGRWGEAAFKGYYLYDLEPTEDNEGYDISNDRYRIDFAYSAMPLTNLFIKSRLRYQSDPRVLQNFYESEYRRNPQPSTYFEANQLWENFSLDLYAQPRINDFFENVERLPELRFSAFRQPVWNSPVYYESESSAGYYRRRFAITNDVVSGANYEAARADTYHQLTLPHTFFGWLNVTPRVGGRLSYYGDDRGPGGTNSELGRAIFNTGAEVTFKASQTWAGTTNRLLALSGLRHIVEPSFNYVFVPTPHHRPNELPQFDYELPSLRLLPIDYPDYNSIDSIDSQNVLRLGLRNRLQTKRGGRIENLLYWNVYTDWRLDPEAGQSDFSDLFSDLAFRPRSWLELESQLRADLHDGQLRLSYNALTLRPNTTWSWSIGHLFVRGDLAAPNTASATNSSSLTSAIFYRLNENWGFRMAHQVDVQEGWLQEQSYSVYRDLRNWTAALTFRYRNDRVNEDDFGVAFTFSLKAMPRYSVGQDAVNPASLLGY